MPFLSDFTSLEPQQPIGLGNWADASTWYVQTTTNGTESMQERFNREWQRFHGKVHQEATTPERSRRQKLLLLT